MYFRQLLHDERCCASYLVGCPSHGVAAVVDPQGDPSFYVDLATNATLRIMHVFDTHIHADHYSCAPELARTTGAKLCLGQEAEVCYEFCPLGDGEILQLGNRKVQVIHTPGHTPEHIALLVDDWFVLSGDALFVGDVGRVDLAAEELDRSAIRRRACDLHHSLRRLLGLDDAIEVYPAHYAGSMCGRGMDGKPISTIGRERRTNRCLKLDLDRFVEFQLAGLPPLPEKFHEIKLKNSGHGSSIPAPR